jgi:3-dehydroquinate dehydratase type I
MQDILCVSIFGNNERELYENILLASTETNFVEIRIDYLSEPTVVVLDHIFRDFPTLKCIMTCRMEQFGGHFQNDSTKWSVLIERCIELNFHYIDIDYGLSQNNLLVDNLKRLRTSCNSITEFIFSYHNFNNTPDVIDLKQIGDEMRSGADIQKIATTVSSDVDLRTLAKYISDKSSDEKYVVVGMGNNKYSRMSRIMSIYLGCEWNFFSLGDKTTATGQIDILSAKKLLELL